MVKIDIVAGFLGAGKTTLINELLTGAYTGEKPVLIENEFGTVSIDESLIVDPEIQVRVLSSGCICCTLKGDFVEGIVDVVTRYAPSHIVIEPSGLAEPMDIISACNEAAETVPVRLNAFITVANAENLQALLTIGGDLFHRQIAGATLLVVNRTNLPEPEKLKMTFEEIRRLNPDCLILSDSEKPFDALSVYAFAEEAMDRLHHCEHHCCNGLHEHTPSFEGISSLAFAPEKAFSPGELNDLFAAFSDSDHSRIFRAKGFLKNEIGGFTHVEYVYGRGECFASDYVGPPKFVVIGTDPDESFLRRFLGEVSS